jgi:hypothetical protein
MRRLVLALAFLSAALAGCTETYQRLDGVTPAAGDAIAANTVMQMVDPWQYGVQDTNIEVPADRASAVLPPADGGGESGDASADSQGGATTGGSGS